MSQNHKSVDAVHIDELLFSVGVGTWDWDLTNNSVIYSAAWAKVLGYNVEELPQVVETWERMVLPEDLEYANKQIELHLNGEKPMYEAEFRMVCKDGSIIWAQDRGHITETAEDGTAIRFMGVLQDVTRLKDAEMRLRDNQETLDLAVNVSELGTWDWDITNNIIRYNNEYLHMLGYSQEDMDGSLEEWESMNHPDDLITSSKLLDAYLAGETPSYTCEIRMRRCDGGYVWTKDIGKIVERDADGKPTRLIGGHLNIDSLKRSQSELTQALEALEHNNLSLESEVAKRTRELVEQDTMLWTVNQISRKLLTAQTEDNFIDLVQDCLQLLGECLSQNRVYIWKDQEDDDGNNSCSLRYEWVQGVPPIKDTPEIATISYDCLPNFAEAINAGRCLNSLIENLSDRELAVLTPMGVKAILIAPIAINGTRWGFIGVDNCETETLFSSTQENMLLMSGSMLASMIEKRDTEAKLREMEERTQMMLDATPLCCNLWTTDYVNMSCNAEAARLFELSSQEEYLQRFHELSPEYQPDGRRSADLVVVYLEKAFSEGYCRFEWMHQKLDGTPLPSEITLVRIKYRDSFIVAGYTRDMRELKQMLGELQSKEDDLRAARDEALLSSKAKSNFLANMSHEIRTPMNAISGLAEIILRESAGRQAAEYAKGIKSACNNLLNIINDILDISKIESGKLEIFQSQYELASVLNDVITISRMRLGSKPLMFITDIDSKLPAQLVGDEIRIKQILINLLSNAIKFTSEGHIALRVSGTLEGGRATLRFTVSDSGTGIKEEDLEKLFAQFERVNTTKNRSIEGTGLGLAISKQLCEMMGGQIEVKSVFGVGSEFTATIPQECAYYERLSQVSESKTVLLYEPRDLYRRSIAESLENLECRCVPCANQSDLYDSITVAQYDYLLTAALYLPKVKSIVMKNKLSVPIAVFSDYDAQISDPDVYSILFPVSCLQLSNLLNGQLGDTDYSTHYSSSINFAAPSARILVVDDNPVNLSVAEGLMSPYMFTVDTASNGLEAVEMVQKTPYDLVFMDHMMPVMDGIDATIAIRRLEGDYYKKLPIIALTANALVGTREMFIREGMNDFLAKPIEINKLGHVLAKWLPQSKMVKVDPKQSQKAKSEGLPLSLSGIDTAQGVLSVGGSREKYLQILSSFYSDGNQKCVSLLRHLTEKDILAFRTEVHAVKSTAATIGATELSSMAAKLEAAAQAQDIEYIDGHIDPFLTSFKSILEAIRPILPTPAATPSDSDAAGSNNAGDSAYLTGKLDELYDAAEFANIGRIERLMSELEAFSWSKAITGELRNIRECLAVFDYDGVLVSIEQLKKL